MIRFLYWTLISNHVPVLPVLQIWVPHRVVEGKESLLRYSVIIIMRGDENILDMSCKEINIASPKLFLLDARKMMQRGKPKNAWRWRIEGEFKTLKHTWGIIQSLGQHKQRLRSFIAALHANRYNRHEIGNVNYSAQQQVLDNPAFLPTNNKKFNLIPTFNC